MRPYFASINPPTVTNIFPVSFFIAFEKSSLSRLNLTKFFFTFFKHILDLAIFYLYFYGLYSCIVFKVLLASYADKINSCHSRLPFFPDLPKLKNICFLVHCFKLLFPNFYYLDR